MGNFSEQVWGLSNERHQRNVVERGYVHLKQWRGIATHYDKHARTFLGGVQLASTILYIKNHVIDPL